MAQRQDTEVKTPAAPYLAFPKEEELVDGTSVTLTWEGVDEADEYIVEVATDTHFDDVVFEKTVSGTTSLTVEDTFATDETTYYWRVIARNEAGEHGTDNVESFIAVTAEEAAALAGVNRREGTEHPDKQEALGPASELVKAASAEAAAEVTGDDKYYDMESELGVEHEGIGAGQVLGFIFAVLAVIAMAIVFVFNVVNIQANRVLVESVAMTSYPQLRDTEAMAAGQMNQYKVLDDQQGIYQIPVERAMDLMVRESRQAPQGSYSSELPLLPGN